MESQNRLNELLDRMLLHTATDAELQELQALLAADESGALLDQAEHRLLEGEPITATDAAKWQQVANKILLADKLERPLLRPLRGKVPVLHRAGWAAAVVVLIGAGAWLFRHQHQHAIPTTTINNQLADVAPATNGAILTLANGQQLVLDSLHNGSVTQQQGTHVVLQGSTLQYDAANNRTAALAYNTVTTPFGKQFQLVLPDGSKVWMNAGSSLQFPVAFNGATRLVKLSGEAYFDVKQNSAQPFHVQLQDGEDLTVLGTEFNVNAYTQEDNSYTTLINGALRVSVKSGSVTLKPGQQAIAAAGGALRLQPSANTESATAWKNGLFNFDGMGLHEMLRQLERWYNLEVVYEGNVPDVRFFGEMSRNLQLADVLAGLQRSDVHFRLEAGRRLVVMP